MHQTGSAFEGAGESGLHQARHCKPERIEQALTRSAGLGYRCGAIRDRALTPHPQVVLLGHAEVSVTRSRSVDSF